MNRSDEGFVEVVGGTDCKAVVEVEYTEACDADGAATGAGDDELPHSLLGPFGGQDISVFELQKRFHAFACAQSLACWDKVSFST